MNNNQLYKPNLIYKKGDATIPLFPNVLIAHICNSIGVWGAGFVISLSKKFQRPEQKYREWARYEKFKFPLGEVQFVEVNNDKFPLVVVANMIAQDGIGFKNGIPPIRYDALEECLKQVYHFCSVHNLVLQGPKFGSGLAGGDWNKIEELIKEHMTVDTYILEF